MIIITFLVCKSIQLGKELRANGHQIITNYVVGVSAKRTEEAREYSLNIRYADSLEVLQTIKNLELDLKIRRRCIPFFVL